MVTWVRLALRLGGALVAAVTNLPGEGLQRGTQFSPKNPPPPQRGLYYNVGSKNH